MASPVDTVVLWKQFCLEQSVKISESGEDGSGTVARAQKFYDFIFAPAAKTVDEPSVDNAES